MIETNQNPKTGNSDVCHRCGARCCKFIAIEAADKATCEWIKGRAVWVVSGLAFLPCPCLYLTEDNRCGVYETRPQFCREHEVGGAKCVLLWNAWGLDADEQKRITGA